MLNMLIDKKMIRIVILNIDRRYVEEGNQTEY